MRRTRWLVAGIAGVLLVCGSAAFHAATRSVAADDAVDSQDGDRARRFETEIAPILARHCLECHDSSSKKGGLDLSQKDAAKQGGEGGAAVVPGQAAESLLWQYVESDEMPKDRPPLSAEQKQRLREWIDDGAVWSLEKIDAALFARPKVVETTWLRRLTVPEYIETVRSALGVDIEADARRLLPPDLRADGFTNTAYSLSVDLEHVEAYAKLARIIVRRMDVAEFASRFTKCQELDEKCFRQIIAAMGKWVLRGPLNRREMNAYLDVYAAVVKERGTFAEAVSYVLEAMLQSPRFLYRIETQRGDGSMRPADDFELASRLSYILWGGPPDEELLRAAEAGELSDRRRIEEQVQRMLEDPRARKQSARFLYEWMDLRRLASLRPNPDRFPSWDSQLAEDMRDETLAYFQEVVWEQERPLADLMNAQVTFATPRLAEHYGLDWSDAVSSPEDQPPARVTDGLQALYTFEEGRGKLVRDVSNAGGPLHLTIEDQSAVEWTDRGLVVKSSTLIASRETPQRLVEAVKQSNALTLEAWITPAKVTQAGPARIVTLSESPNARNFTLGQEGDKFDVRFRTTATGRNGIPSLTSPDRAVQTKPTHVVYTRDGGGRATLYVDGRNRATRNVGGTVSNWDNSFRLALGNELSKDRPWHGTLHLVALYDRALSADEVQRNRAAGAHGIGASALEALYTFRTGRGDVVHDRSGRKDSLDLKIENPSAVAWDETGLTVKDSTLIATVKPPKRLINAVKRSQAVTLEAWITPANTRQAGPARIVTLSDGTGQRNFTLGQDGDKYEVRFRTKATNANGLPGVNSKRGSVATGLTHVAYTRDTSGRARLYINGEEHQARSVTGDLSNWNGKFLLALANETTKDRAWRGTYHRVAIYSRALTPDEIRSKVSAPSRYDLAAAPGRGGLLTQGSILTIGGDDASMVTRGLFILHDLLYSRVGNPPPCVDTTPVPTKPGLTQRAIALQRIANPACGGCHSKFEPLAFGLEKFDGLGAYHEQDEHGNALRDDGEILFPGEDEPVAYESSAEMMDLLAASERIRMGITRKVAQFAIGRPLVRADEPIVERIHKTAQKNGGTYKSLITAIVMSDLVQMTRTEKIE